jgi:6-phosphogluconolactonase
LKPDVRIVSDAEELGRAAASEFLLNAGGAVARTGIFTTALSGGSTPNRLYTLLSEDAGLRERLPWDRIHFFWGDERHVPPEHAESNYRAARDSMLSKAPVPPDNVHRIRGELQDAGDAAAEYETLLRLFFSVPAGRLPRFDLLLLGLGSDGHIASLFPGTDALLEQRRLVVANWVERVRSHRITLTLPVINNASAVIFLVSGAEKASIVKRVLNDNDPALPAFLVRPVNGKLIWFVDRAAAAECGD